MRTESSENCAITLSSVNFSGNIGQTTIFSWILTIACCLAIGSGLGLDIVYGWLTFLYYFALTLYRSRLMHAYQKTIYLLTTFSKAKLKPIAVFPRTVVWKTLL